MITFDQLLGTGYSPGAVRYHVRVGNLIKMHPGVYVFPGAPWSRDQVMYAAWKAAGEPSALGYRSAAAVWEFEGIQAVRPEVVVAHDRRFVLDGVLVHRTRELPLFDIVQSRGFAVTRPVRTLIDLGKVVSPLHLERALDGALRRGLVTLTSIVERLDMWGARGVTGAAILRYLVDARLGRGIVESALEARFVRKLRRLGFPEPVAQFEIRTPDGSLVARVDFAYPDVRIAIEVDGFAFHSGRERWSADLERQNRIVAAGWRPMRFTNADIDDDAAWEPLREVLGSPA